MLLRTAVPEDALAVAQVHVRAWQAAYRGLLPADSLERLRPHDRAQRYEFGATDPSKPSTIVAVEGGAIVGFATLGPARDPDAPGCGELFALYVDPHWWGRGIGRALIEQSRARLAALGFRAAVLWVMVGNTRAERFYRGDGWRHDGARRRESIWNISVEVCRYGRALAGD